MFQYYIVDDLRQGRLEISHFPRLTDAVRAYKALPDANRKALGVQDGNDAADLILRVPLRPGELPGEDVLDLGFLEQGGWKSNICIAGHNRGVRNDFGKIHTLQAGDTITFTTVLGTRTYSVTGVAKVSVNDVSGLNPSSTNMITLYTCVEDQPAYRWCVTAVAMDG